MSRESRVVLGNLRSFTSTRHTRSSNHSLTETLPRPWRTVAHTYTTPTSPSRLRYHTSDVLTRIRSSGRNFALRLAPCAHLRSINYHIICVLEKAVNTHNCSAILLLRRKNTPITYAAKALTKGPRGGAQPWYTFYTARSFEV